MVRISATVFAVRRVPPGVPSTRFGLPDEKKGDEDGPAAARRAAVYHFSKMAETERL
jgi:hypothetical protein